MIELTASDWAPAVYHRYDANGDLFRTFTIDDAMVSETGLFKYMGALYRGYIHPSGRRFISLKSIGVVWLDELVKVSFHGIPPASLRKIHNTTGTNFNCDLTHLEWSPPRETRAMEKSFEVCSLLKQKNSIEDVLHMLNIKRPTLWNHLCTVMRYSDIGYFDNITLMSIIPKKVLLFVKNLYEEQNPALGESLSNLCDRFCTTEAHHGIDDDNLFGSMRLMRELVMRKWIRMKFNVE